MRLNSGCFRVFAGVAAMSAAIALGQEMPSQPPVQGQPQDQPVPAPQRGWRRVPEAPPVATPAPDSAYPVPVTTPPATMPQDPGGTPSQAPPPNSNGGYRPADAYGQTQPGYSSHTPYPNQRGAYQNPGYPRNGAYRPLPQVPPELTIKPGTYLTVRIDQPLSSDHNHAGEGFSATLVKPVVVDGVLVAQSGQTLGGRVVEATKAGRVEGTSRLAIELIDMSLVDGSQVPVKTQFLGSRGPTSVGQDLATIGGTTAFGAAVGAAAAWGTGAAIGAAAGAAAGLVGVLVTRGHPAVIYPESVLTFRVENPVTISTERAPQAFRFADPQDYQQAATLQPQYQASAPAPRVAAPYYAYGYPSPYAYPYPWYGYYPYYWAPGFAFYFGPWYHGGYYRGGYYYHGGGYYHGHH